MLINTWYSGKDSELPRKLSIAPTKFLNIKAGGNKMNVKRNDLWISIWNSIKKTIEVKSLKSNLNVSL